MVGIVRSGLGIAAISRWTRRAEARCSRPFSRDSSANPVNGYRMALEQRSPDVL
jgi:hypothetical protein